MSRFTLHLSASVLSTLMATAAFGQTTTPEQEPNGAKSEATSVIGMVAGDCLSGRSLGAVVGAGNSGANTADYWDISTAPQSTPGWYRWSLTVSAGQDIDIRGLSLTGSIGNGSMPIPGSDSLVQNDFSNEIHWYSNESASRLYVLIDGSGASPATYTACLSCTPVAPTVLSTSFTPGMIQITTVGQTTTDTDLSVADSTRTIIPGYVNDDVFAMPGSQSLLTRSYAEGTYYLVLSDFDQNTSEGAAADDDFVLGEAMDFPNVFVGARSTSGVDLSFMIDDGQGNSIAMPATKGLPHGLEFFEFTVEIFPNRCNGDGGDQLGCADCPCNNNAPVGTIGGCLNSSGNGTRLLASGDRSVSLPPGDTTDLRFAAQGVPSNAFCVLNSGDTLAPTNVANPCFGTGNGVTSVFFDGLRCAVQNTLRHGGRAADANGEVGVTNNPWGGEGSPAVGIAVAGAFAAGQTRYFQIIHRDDPLVVCSRGLNSSQAVTVTFTP